MLYEQDTTTSHSYKPLKWSTKWSFANGATALYARLAKVFVGERSKIFSVARRYWEAIKAVVKSALIIIGLNAQQLKRQPTSPASDHSISKLEARNSP